MTETPDAEPTLRDVLAKLDRIERNQAGSFRDIRRILREDRQASRKEHRELTAQVGSLSARFEDMIDDVAGFRGDLLDHTENHP